MQQGPPPQVSLLHHAAERAPRYTGMLDALTRIHAEDGVRGYFRGIKPRLALHTPAVAISWTTYELFKRVLTDRGIFGDD